MRQTFTLRKHFQSLVHTAALGFALFCQLGIGSAQEILLPLITGFQVKVTGAPPTICQPSTAKAIPGNFFIVPFITPNLLSTNGETYHVATAGKTDTLTVDIPAVGNLPYCQFSVELSIWVSEYQPDRRRRGAAG